ncbi:LysR family transcriptional regulator [Bradyrhizobium sp. Leo170]|uniref:LysR family transcriptional regulator n=1 Tax=Bradyrhizobium sp. Leo170 TaxID=1571199 RepID=UPI0024BF6E98|nr:LysR family transcriptional regulator [Bradyrhizobium sp. Leo170]
MSMQIKLLEDQVGVALLHRTTRHVELTAEGVQLLEHAKRALGEWEHGLREIREAIDIQRGTLSLACVPTIAATILPQVLSKFQSSYPGISITLRELAAEDMLDCLRRRETDFGIGPAMDGTTEFQFTPLFTDPIYALATHAYPFRKRHTVDLAELSTYPILLNSKSAALRSMLERALAGRSLHMTIKFEVEHSHTLGALAAAGLGVGILPKVALPHPLKRNMQALPITNPALERTVCIVSLKGRSFSPSAGALAATVHRLLKAKS